MDINEMNQMYESLGIRREVREFAAETEQTLKERFESIDAVAEYNQMKVIKGMQDNRVSDIHFAATTGYGYNDLGLSLIHSCGRAGNQPSGCPRFDKKMRQDTKGL